MNHIFNDLIDLFSLPVSLKMTGRASDEISAQIVM
jgi:hypothetical protein